MIKWLVFKSFRLIVKSIWNGLKFVALLTVIFVTSKLSNEYFEDKRNLIVDNNVHNIFRGQGKGTSFQYMRNGNVYTVTNAHVCGDADFLISQGFNLQVLSSDVSSDLCILVPTSNIGLIGNELELKVHQKIFTIGSPKGLDYSMREGRIIADKVIHIPLYELTSEDDVFNCLAQRALPMNGLCVRMHNLIFTTMHANVGASGSPVLDSYGSVIGVLNSIDTQTFTAYFIPVEKLNLLIDDYEENKKK